MDSSQVRVLTAYEDGVLAVERYGARVGSASKWDSLACGHWTTADLAGHLMIAVRWYNENLDRAERGDARPRITFKELDHANDVAVAELPKERDAGPVRLRAYAESARAYAERIPKAWDLPYGFPGGTVTVGLHAGVAALEYHVHAWDLARVVGEEHRPADPTIILRCAAAALA